MKLDDVLVTNGVNMIIGKNDYDVNNLKLYLLKSYSIVNYDGTTLFGLDIMKGEEQSKPSIFIIDIRYKEYNDTEYIIDLLNAYVKEKYDIPLLILCSINNNCTFEPKPVENYFANNGLDKESIKGIIGNIVHEPYINCKSVVVYNSQCILKYIDNNLYEVVKSTNYMMHGEIVNLEEV